MTLYDANIALVAAILLGSLVFAMVAGHRLGARLAPDLRQRIAGHINLIQGSVLGLMALLLGFTFSLSLQRFDVRSEAAVAEADAIRAADLRARLLGDPMREAAQQSLRTFVDLRVEMVTAPSAREAERDARIAEARRQLDALQSQAVEAVRADPRSPYTGPYLQAIDSMTSALVRRDAAMTRHVPETVLLLLYGSFLITALIVGYATGVAGHRLSFVAYLLVGLIVILSSLILDVDSPRRGTVQVSEKSLRDLQADLRTGSGAGASAATRPRATSTPASSSKPTTK